MAIGNGVSFALKLGGGPFEMGRWAAMGRCPKLGDGPTKMGRWAEFGGGPKNVN